MGQDMILDCTILGKSRSCKLVMSLLFQEASQIRFACTMMVSTRDTLTHIMPGHMDGTATTLRFPQPSGLISWGGWHRGGTLRLS